MAPVSIARDDRAEDRARLDWARNRAIMELGGRVDRFDGMGFERLWKPIRAMLGAVGQTRLLRGIYGRGVRNALDIRLERFELAFEALPAAFDGYTILHLTDPHFDALDGIAGRVAALTARLEVDICALTGDYGESRFGSFAHTDAAMRDLVAKVTARDGFVAVLGNHDSVDLVGRFERMGVRVLANETISIERAGARVHLTGLDDVHYFYTDRARDALFAAPDGFGVALVHSPEIAEVAAEAGFALYLAGHTHGGQVCLPGGRPIFTNLRCNRAFAAGLWRCGGMVGYTSAGAGVSVLPVRFNSRGEVTLITLRRAAG